nr:MAG TPA: hypothetical protein [Caudoviricetes sp.]
MKKYISNAFSLQMLDTSKEVKVNITPISEDFKKDEEVY